MTSSSARSNAVSFDTGHTEQLHDCQLDYYGKRLATASSDRTIKIFEVAHDRQIALATLTGHEGPVWQVAWGHPKFGSLLASCSYDGRVFLWKEMQSNFWQRIFEFARSEGSMNSVAFAPHSFGLSLACGCSDGTVSICTRNEQSGRFEVQTFMAHAGGVNAVSWGPDIATGSVLAPSASLSSSSSVPLRVERRFVSGGFDHRLRIWKQHDDATWHEDHVFALPSSSFPSSSSSSSSSPSSSSSAAVADTQQHSDVVRDVAWAPSLGLPANTIASASEDKTVGLWYEGVDGQ